MIEKLLFITSECRDPFRNLAFEEYLTLHTEPGEMALYLWKNRDTIVFGRNQDILAECRAADFQRSGGRVVRRLSGGGTVYHDEGNLNFTFAVRHADYDVRRQLEVILGAVRKLGVRADFSGRNDLVAENRKFSGNAFYRSGDFHYHHGTLLIDSDMGRMSEYLTVDPEKLRSRGVRSVSGRVVNLAELVPGLTTEKLISELCLSLESVYGRKAELLSLDNRSLPAGRPSDPRFSMTELESALERGADFFSSDRWNFGTKIRSDLTAEARYDWGSLRVVLEVEEGKIKDCRIYSDGMDPDVTAKAQEAITGIKCSLAAAETALQTGVPGDGRETAGLLELLERLLPERKEK